MADAAVLLAIVQTSTQGLKAQGGIGPSLVLEAGLAAPRHAKKGLASVGPDRLRHGQGRSATGLFWLELARIG